MRLVKGKKHLRDGTIYDGEFQSGDLYNGIVYNSDGSVGYYVTSGKWEKR